MRNWFILLLLITQAFAHASELPERSTNTGHLKVVASIKPIHSLLAGIMQGVGQPSLLLGSNQSPHHYSLRPSERRMLADADLVFWIGPGLESFMPHLIESFDKTTLTVSLMKTNGLFRMPLRSSDRHEVEHSHDKDDRQYDPHIWLNTLNIEKMADEITRQLIKADPENTRQYENNNRTLKQRTITLRKKLQQLLDNADQSFLTYHDAYQYFEQEFGLNNAGFVSTGSDIPPGAWHIRELKQLIQKQSIRCVFYDAPVKPPVIRTLLSSSNAQAVALDASGMMLPPGKDNLFQSIESLAEKFSGCLKAGG